MSVERRPPSKLFRRLVLALLLLAHLGAPPGIYYFTGASDLEYQHDLGYLLGQATLIGLLAVAGPGRPFYRLGVAITACGYQAAWSRFIAHEWGGGAAVATSLFVVAGCAAATAAATARISQSRTGVLRPPLRVRPHIHDLLFLTFSIGVLMALVRHYSWSELTPRAPLAVAGFAISAILHAEAAIALLASNRTTSLRPILQLILVGGVVLAWTLGVPTVISHAIALFGSVYLLRLAGWRWSAAAGLFDLHAASDDDD